MIRKRVYYLCFAAWSIIYLVGILIAPVVPSRLNLTATRTHILLVLIALPVILIWAIAVYGAERFKSYTRSINDDPDGAAMDRVSTGLNVLVASVLSNGISGILRPWALRDGWLESFTIIFNIFQAVLPLLAFYLMYDGSKKLKLIATKKRDDLRSWLPVIILMTVVGIAYLSIILSYAYRNSTPDPTKYSSFYMPDSLIVFGIALPYLLGWILGIKASLNISLYRQRIKGIIYRAALRKFIIGMWAVIGFAIILQLLLALSTYFSHAGLGAIILIVYLIIIAYSIGFLFIAAGAKKLKAIEKVKLK